LVSVQRVGARGDHSCEFSHNSFSTSGSAQALLRKPFQRLEQRTDRLGVSVASVVFGPLATGTLKETLLLAWRLVNKSLKAQF
jgi:hypothetical protein